METIPHYRKVQFAWRHCLQVLDEHIANGDITEKGKELAKSVYEDVNHGFSQCPMPLIKVQKNLIVLTWIRGDTKDIYSRLIVGINCELMCAHVEVEKKEDDGDFKTSLSTETLVDAHPVNLTMRHGKPVEPYTKHFIVIPDSFIEAVSIKEEIPETCKDLLHFIPPNVSFDKTVRIAWVTNRYDGPLSGYCYVGDKFCYFDLEYEEEYSRKRYYEVRALSCRDKMRATLHHKWHAFIWSSWRGTHCTKYYQWKQRTFNTGWHAAKAQTKIERHRKWREARRLLGYFSY